MKCWKWGHYTAECRATNNMCRTYGGDHMTRECDKPGKRHCVSCCSDKHASWDRVCPEFQRKSTHFDEIHPENVLTYFPTEESWTLNIRPDRIPVEDRFPAKFATAPPPIQHKTKPCPSFAHSHKQRGCAPGKGTDVQGTLDSFIEARSTERLMHPFEEEEQCNEEEEQEANSLIQTSPHNQ